MEEAKKDNGVNLEPLITRPKRIALVAMGMSAPVFVQEMLGRRPAGEDHFDEVWAINRGVRAFPHDKLFVMDDLKWLETSKDKNYARMLKEHDKPIFTSTAYPEYPMAVPYPFDSVLEFIGDDIFTHNTVAYATAYAMSIGVHEVNFYGCDFVYPDGRMAEDGAQAVAYLLGMFKGLGMVHGLPQSTTLINANKVEKWPDGSTHREYYGYHRIRQMKEAEDRKQREEEKYGPKS